MKNQTPVSLKDNYEPNLKKEKKQQQATHLTRHTSVLKTFPASSKAINIFRPLLNNEVLELFFNQLLPFLNPNKDDRINILYDAKQR